MQNINRALQSLKLDGITIVRDKLTAKKVVDILYKNKNRIHAWDSETININVKEQNPACGIGNLICASAFIGPEVNFGNGPRLFIDNYMDAQDVIHSFKDYFQDETIFKVWHNYGFDRHIFYNEGINVQGFGGDTLHMARLCDTSLLDYSLEGCSKQ